MSDFFLMTGGEVPTETKIDQPKDLSRSYGLRKQHHTSYEKWLLATSGTSSLLIICFSETTLTRIPIPKKILSIALDTLNNREGGTKEDFRGCHCCVCIYIYFIWVIWHLFIAIVCLKSVSQVLQLFFNNGLKLRVNSVTVCHSFLN